MQGGAAEGSMEHGPGRRGLAAAMWLSLVPLTLLLHPYAGVVQDARIYIGRGVADRDPAGVGRDVMFAHDEQTGFSLMRELVDTSLHVMGPSATAMALTLVGVMAWLAAAVAVARTLGGIARVDPHDPASRSPGAERASGGVLPRPRSAKGLDAWAVAVCLVALPTFYGAYRVFDYAEAVATPRVFAEAAVLGAFAALMAERRRAAAGLLALAMAFHPLIALPGVAVGAVLLVRRDRRWLLAVAALAVATLAAAALKVPLAARLVEPMDDTWLSLLRQRSTYLFPSLWPAQSFGPILCQATAVAVAAAVSAPAVRALLLANLGVAGLGLAASWVAGDLHASTLIVQLQPWRALWLLATFGNAALALAAIALWRRGAEARLTLAPLALAWLWSDQLGLAAALAVLTLCWLAAVLRNAVPPVSPLLRWAVAGTVCAVALFELADAAWVGFAAVRAAHAQGGRAGWPMVVGLQIPTVPVVAGALALALLAPARLSARWRRGMAAAVVCGCVASALQWDGRPAERRLAEDGGADPALRAAIGPAAGDVMWVDEDSETWFLAGRPSFFNSVQGAPILFSRTLALDWADRAAFARRLGLAREAAVSPWADPHPRLDPVVLRADAVALFCASPRRPAAVVAPGEQRGAAPAGWTASLWRPAAPFRRLWLDGEAIRWTSFDVFTVIRCPAPVADDGRSGDRRGDARSLG